VIVDRIIGCVLYDNIYGDWKSDQRYSSAPAALIQFFYQFAKDIQGGEVTRIQFNPHLNSKQLITNENPINKPNNSSATKPNRSSNNNAGLRGNRNIGLGYGISALNAQANMIPPGNEIDTNNNSASSNSITNSAAAVRRRSILNSPSNSKSSSLEMFSSANTSVICCMFIQSNYEPTGTAARQAIIDRILDSFMADYGSIYSNLTNQLNSLAKTHPDEALQNETFLVHFKDFSRNIKELDITHNSHKLNNLNTANSIQSVQEDIEGGSDLNGIELAVVHDSAESKDQPVARDDYDLKLDYE
jgi:hypothetical protein